jgi:hypothetical protein
MPITNIPFNPFFDRRYLRACLRMQRGGCQRIAINGAGSHTDELLRFGLLDAIGAKAILVTKGQPGSMMGIPIMPMEQIRTLDIHANLLSSSSFEPEMAEEAPRAAVALVIPLYQDSLRRPHARQTCGKTPHSMISIGHIIPSVIGLSSGHLQQRVDDTCLPQRILVDYVRVCQSEATSGSKMP